MKKNLSELNLNPINPRKIDDASFLKLMQSVLLFPKMLELRDIIVNADGIVLSGNQRLKALRKIADMDRNKLNETLQSSTRYASLGDEKKKSVLDFWEEWQKNTIVEVTLTDTLTEEEEKELLIKDNKEFGMFDMDALKGIYDEDTLADFGIDIPTADLSFFDDGSQEEESDNEQKQEEESDNEQTFYEILRFGSFRLPISEHEYSNLYRRWNEYTEQTGSFDGFVSHLIETKNNA